MNPSSSAPEAEERSHSTTMVWRVHEFGPPEVMKFERVPRPEPGPGEVLVKIEAAGVGPWDGWIRAGKSALPQPLPLTLGSDLSGEIVAVGPGVSELRAGEQVCDKSPVYRGLCRVCFGFREDGLEQANLANLH
jgi:NADPH:quinone reductase-like Zn-dependent oxidoreductase